LSWPESSSPEQLLGLAARTPARHLADIASAVAVEAAALVRRVTGRAQLAGTKSSPTDVVTHTDVESERFIRHELLQRCPGSAIVGEELDNDVGSNSIEWIVDPIDGTVNFLYDLPVVAVSIAARLGDRVIAGAVADVLRGDLFLAAVNEGASLNDQPIRVAGDQAMSESLIGTGFAYDAAVRAEQAEVLTRLLPAARDIRCMGSAALNLCWVGCGRLDGYYERGTKLYDYAAASLIATEAGVVVELPDGATSDVVMGARPGIFDELRALVQPIS